MRQARVIYKDETAGTLTQGDDGSFVFRYDDAWWDSSDKPAISLTLPKTQQVYRSDHLFPFFFHLLPEGANKEAACFALRIDRDDHFGLLLHTAAHDTIGAVRIQRTAVA
jgi:serine/threonine-protein kinase HipA